MCVVTSTAVLVKPVQSVDGLRILWRPVPGLQNVPLEYFGR